MASNGYEPGTSKYITLVSSDGFEFVVLREAALVSEAIKGMLRGQFTEAKTGRCVFPEIKCVFPHLVILQTPSPSPTLAHLYRFPISAG